MTLEAVCVGKHGLVDGVTVQLVTRQRLGEGGVERVRRASRRNDVIDVIQFRDGREKWTDRSQMTSLPSVHFHLELWSRLFRLVPQASGLIPNPLNGKGV